MEELYQATRCKLTKPLEAIGPEDSREHYADNSSRVHEKRRFKWQQAVSASERTVSAGFSRVVAGVSDVVQTFKTHTRGVGMRLREKIRCKGGALGTNEEVVAVPPIEATRRPQTVGLGLNESCPESDNGLGRPIPRGQGEERNCRVEKSEMLQRDRSSKHSTVRQLRRLQKELSKAVGSLEMITAQLVTMNKSYEESQFKRQSLGVVVVWIFMPAMIAKFRGWEPLRCPHDGTEVMSLFQDLLEDCGQDESATLLGVGSLHGSSLPPYTKLVMEAVVPALTLAAANSWEPRDPEPMLAFLKVWEKLLPPPVLQYILESLVIPKLTVGVDNWEPRAVTSLPIQAWLDPWLPVLGSRMAPLYEAIRCKFRESLQFRHPQLDSREIENSSGSNSGMLWSWPNGQRTVDDLADEKILKEILETLAQHDAVPFELLVSTLPVHQRHDAIACLADEADIRFRDPVYGCTGMTWDLQNQVKELQAELVMLHAFGSGELRSGLRDDYKRR